VTLPSATQRFLAALVPEGLLTDELTVNIRALVHGAPSDTADQRFLASLAVAGTPALFAHWNTEEGRSLYFAPGLRRGHNGKKDGVAVLTALWADLDAKAILRADHALTVEERSEGKRRARQILLDRLPAGLQPSVIVDSGGGLQAWWPLKEPALVGDGDDAYQLSTLEGYLKGLARHLDADPAVAQLAALMRLPGYVNRKYPDAPMAEILEDHSERRFTLTDFDEYFLAASSLVSTPALSGSNGRRRIESLGTLAPVLEMCGFLQWCRDHPAEVPEPLWWAMLSNLVRLEGGREAAHAFSKGHPGYSVAETDAKLAHARAGSAPISCAKIQALGFTAARPRAMKS
jgi:hypothetical protein